MIAHIKLQPAFPLKRAPLVHCITNDISLETLANALLYIGAKPFMADYPTEFADVFEQTDALLLNLGHLSSKQVDALQHAAQWANQTGKPTVLDVVGTSATTLRARLAKDLLTTLPSCAVVKGNISEMRTFAGLPSQARGVDSDRHDQVTASLRELASSLQRVAAKFPQTVFLATGIHDLVITADQCLLLVNGVPELDRFTGSGDIVGALIAAVLGIVPSPLQATLNAVSYLNICGERAAAFNKQAAGGLDSFRHLTLDQLSLLAQNEHWSNAIKITDFS